MLVEFSRLFDSLGRRELSGGGIELDHRVHGITIRVVLADLVGPQHLAVVIDVRHAHNATRVALIDCDIGVTCHRELDTVETVGHIDGAVRAGRDRDGHPALGINGKR